MPERRRSGPIILVFKDQEVLGASFHLLRPPTKIRHQFDWGWTPNPRYVFNRGGEPSNVEEGSRLTIHLVK